jgi:uncharacterized protein
MVRGPQTLGELRTRAERMHPFDDLAEVESVLDRMTPELVTKLSRRAGEKEARYAHLLAGTPEMAISSDEQVADFAAPPQSDRMTQLEAEVASLRRELEDLKQQFAGFQKQFE